MLGNHVREERSAECLRAALYEAHENREHIEFTRAGHAVRENANAGVHDEADEDGKARADLSGQTTERKSERNANELDEQDSGDEIRLSNADLGAVHGGHFDDGLNAIVVNGEGEHGERRLFVATQFPQSFAKSRERDRKRVRRCRFVSLKRAWRLGHDAKERNGKDQPPYSDGDKRESRRQRGLRRRQTVTTRQAKGAGIRDPRQVERQQEAAADVAKRVTGGRDAIHFVFARDVRQERLIERHAARRATDGQHKDDGCVQNLAAADEKHGGRRGHADKHEGHEKLFLRGAIVGDGSQKRRQHRDEDGANRVRVAPPLRGLRRR